MFLLFCLRAYGQGTPDYRPLIQARFLVTESRFADAEAILEDLKAASPDPVRTALTVGKALAGLGRYAESNDWLARVTGDSQAEASYAMAKNSVALKDYPSAIQHLGRHLSDQNHYPEKVIRMDPSFSALENSREWIHLWQKDWYSPAEQKAAECEYLLAQDQPEEAEALANEILSDNEEDPRAWLLLARVSLVKKDERRFRQRLDKAWLQSSGYLAVREELLRLAVGENYVEKANEMASELLRRDPSNPDYLVSRALVRILGGNESLALKELSATEEAGITPSEIYYQAGRKISGSRPVQAEQFFTRAIGNEKMDARFFYARGVARISLDKTTLALEDMAMSLDIDPNQPDLYFQRARLRLDSGDLEGACYDWKKALEMGNPKAADELYKHCKLP